MKEHSVRSPISSAPRNIVILVLAIATVLFARGLESADSSSPFFSPTGMPMPSKVTVTMYEFSQFGDRTGPLCTASSVMWGCTTHCSNFEPSPCTPGTNVKYPFGNNNRPTLTIDGTIGSPFYPYDQYLRDVVPNEIAITLGSQGDKPISAIESQAIAARTYIYHRIKAGYAIDNSNSFQVFVPYYFDSLNATQRSSVASGVANQRYMAIANQINPIVAFYGADNGSYTSQGNTSYLKSVPDPISAAYGQPIGTTLGGMSSRGISRWGFGHTSSRGPVAWGNSNYPHDIVGSGDYWSVKLGTSSQILTHYYTGIDVLSSGGVNLTPTIRWVPLSIGQSGTCPPLMTRGVGCTLTIQVQNTGISSWTCSGSTAFLLSYRWAKLGRPEQNGQGTVSLCNGGSVAAGNVVNVSLPVNDIPNWGAGPYTLKLDMINHISSGDIWISKVPPNNWPTYDISICVNGYCRYFLPNLRK